MLMFLGLSDLTILRIDVWPANRRLKSERWSILSWHSLELGACYKTASATRSKSSYADFSSVVFNI